MDRERDCDRDTEKEPMPAEFHTDPDGHLNVAYVVSETQPPEVEPEIKVVVQPVETVSTVKKVSELVHVRPCWQRHLGIFFALLNALCFSLIPVIVKKLQHIHPVGQTVWRSLVNVFICALVLLVLRWLPSTRHLRVWAGIVDANGTVEWSTVGVVIGMGLLVITGMIFRVTALEYMTIADATVVTYIAIVFVLLLAHFILRESCTFSKSSTAALIILGACVIARPPFLTGASNFDKNLLIGIGMKCADGAAQAGYSVMYRKWRHLHFAATLFIILIVGNVEATCAAFALQVFTLPTSTYDVVQIGRAYV